MTEEKPAEMPILGIKDGKIEVERANGTTWFYAIKPWELNGRMKEIAELLTERQKEKWDMLAVGYFTKPKDKRFMHLEGVGL